jgi:uncharacterized repeat protein (TIGR03803 family)
MRYTKQFRSAITLGLILLGASSSSHAGILFTNIFSFNGTNGAQPSVLVQAGNNKFYGVTEAGGPNFTGPENPDAGGVFSITSDGVFSNLFFFEGTNGSSGGYLTPGKDGNFYGTTDNNVFKLNPDGTMANPHLALGLNLPYGIVQDHDGTLYGTARFGGPSNSGGIYKIDTNGVLSMLVTFNGTNGAEPVVLLLGADNNFYGVTQEGGNGLGTDGGDGTVFRMDRSGNLTNIFLFNDDNDQPVRLVQASNGDLYGVTILGGTNNLGTIFRITTNGTLVWSFSFNGTNGYGGTWITAATDGNLYATTLAGGNGYDGTEDYSGFGTVFRITPGGSFTSLVQFDGTNDYHAWSIVQGTDGNFYGTSGEGGTFGQGAVFKLAVPTNPAQNGLMPITVANFYLDTNGSVPRGLMQGSDGMLYGVTFLGGTFDDGTIFKSTLSGSLTTLVSFDGTNGYGPYSPPLQASDGNFYGTTWYGGPDWNDATATNEYGNFYGTVYRMDTNGVLTTLCSFNQTNGSHPSDGGLILANDGALYGVTYAGGPNFANVNKGDGTIFRITTTGDFTMLASFNGTNGYSPENIIQASDGNFYGTTQAGGIDDTSRNGTVFRMTPDGQITSLFRFNGTNGADPVSLMQASDGCLYGTTLSGGAFGDGSVFKLTTNGDFTLLASFDSTNGANPGGGLTEVANGILYGTTQHGGQHFYGAFSDSEGTFFQITTNGNLSVLFSFGANSPSEPELPFIPVSTLVKASDGNYYATSLAPNEGTIYSIRPVEAPVLQTAMQSNQLNLSWNAWAGYSYAVMYETNLTGSNWNLLTNVMPETNGPASVLDTIGPDAQRFYQVILQLP